MRKQGGMTPKKQGNRSEHTSILLLEPQRARRKRVIAEEASGERYFENPGTIGRKQSCCWLSVHISGGGQKWNANET